MSCPIGEGGDLGAYGRAVAMLREDFDKNMKVSFDTAW